MSGVISGNFGSREAFFASEAHQSVCRIIPCGFGDDCQRIGTLGQIKMHREETHSNKLMAALEQFDALRLRSTSFRARAQMPDVISAIRDHTEFNAKHDASISLLHTLCEMLTADITGGCLIVVSVSVV